MPLLFTGRELRAMAQGAVAALAEVQERVNALNVFPVPDGDTGTNMFLTLQAAMRELEKTPPGAPLPTLLRALAYGALMGARGNSGVILSQLCRGFQEGAQDRESLEGTGLAKALRRASDMAYRAVLRPVEGTLLTVAREAARAAMNVAAQGGDSLAVWEAYTLGAEAALALTPSLLPALREAGVVDAGGQGLVFLCRGALEALQRLAAGGSRPTAGTVASGTVAPAERDTRVGERQPLPYTYCTEFLLQGENLPLEELRRTLASFGDSLLVVGDPTVAKIHLHSNHPGTVLEHCLKLGQLSEIHINNMVLQQEAFQGGQGGKITEPGGVEKGEESEKGEAGTSLTAPSLRILAVATGKGLAAIFRNLGAGMIVEGGQTMNPATEDLLAGIQALPPGPVILLPNNKNIILTAQQVVGLAGREATVVPSKTIPQGIAALLAFNPEADLAANVAAMTAAIEAVKTGEVTYAVRNSRYNGIKIEEADYIGLADGEIVVAGKARTAVTLDLIGKLAVEPAGFITLYYGQDVPRGEVEEITQQLRAAYPDYEVEVHDGGQPLYYYIIAVE